MENEGITPDTVTYNILIEGLCGDNKLERAKDLFNELGSKGMMPDVVTFNILIGALCKEGNTEEAKDLVVQMVENGCSPDSGTYNVLVGGYVKRKGILSVRVLLLLNNIVVLSRASTYVPNKPPYKNGGSKSSFGHGQWHDNAECHYCHEIRHIKRNCPKLRNKKHHPSAHVAENSNTCRHPSDSITVSATDNAKFLQHQKRTPHSGPTTALANSGFDDEADYW